MADKTINDVRLKCLTFQIEQTKWDGRSSILKLIKTILKLIKTILKLLDKYKKDDENDIAIGMA